MPDQENNAPVDGLDLLSRDQRPAEPEVALEESNNQIAENQQTEPVVEEQLPVSSESNTEELSQDQQTQPKAEDNDGDQFDWDYNLDSEQKPTEETQTQAELPHLDTISKAFGSDVTLTQDEIIARAESVLKENQDLKEKSANPESQFANEKLKEANDFAAKGGDWQEFLGITSTNWDAIDSKSLVAWDVEQTFPGDENAEKRREMLEEMSDHDIDYRGSQLRNSHKANQQSQIDAMNKKAEESRVKAHSDLKKQLNETKHLFGIEMDSTEKQTSFDRISGGDFGNSIYHDKDGNVDHAHVQKVEWLSRRDDNGQYTNLKKVVSHHVNKGRREGAKSVVDQATNSSVQQSNARGSHVESFAPAKQKGGKMDNALEQMAKTGQQI